MLVVRKARQAQSMTQRPKRPHVATHSLNIKPRRDRNRGALPRGSEDRFPASHCVARAGDVTALVRPKQYIDRRHFDRLSRAAERCLGAKVLHGFVRHRRRNKRSPDWPWRNTVHANSLAAQQLRQSRSEIGDRALGRGVCQQTGRRIIRIH